MRKIAAFGMILVTAGLALGQVNNAVSREVKGRGATRQLAIKDALYEAVSQVQGVVVSSGLVESGVVVGSLDVTRQEVRKSIELEGVSVRGIDTITLTQAEGLVKSYEVLQEQQLDNDTYEVTVKAWVYDYTSPLADTKTPLAVTDFEVNQPVSPFGPLQVSADELSRQFSAILTSQLIASGRFTLLDRAYAEAFAKEKALWASEDTNLREKAKLGQVVGAEYLLAGQLRRADIVMVQKVLPATGYTVTEYEGHFVAETRLFAAATRQVAYVGRYRLRLETNDVKNLLDEWVLEEIDYDELKDRLLEIGARRIVEDMLEQMYPVRVAVTDPATLILDQGGKRLSAGDVYTVVGAGQEVRDPQTNELLGQAETPLATIEVRQVLPRFSYATILDGSSATLQVGNICRYHRPKFEIESEAAEAGRKHQIRTTPAGGVKLPFDP